MPVRIYDISKKLGLENKDIISKAKALGITAAKVASSSLDKITAEFLEEEILKDHPDIAAKLHAPKVETPKAPVIEEKVVFVTAPHLRRRPHPRSKSSRSNRSPPRLPQQPSPNRRRLSSPRSNRKLKSRISRLQWRRSQPPLPLRPLSQRLRLRP